MKQTVPVVINAGGGAATSKGDALEAEIRAAFDRAGMAIDLHLVAGDDLVARLQGVADDPLIVVGGGDGTIAAGAAVARQHGATLGILPLGTRNHLARELGIPLDLPGAAALIAHGNTRRIDLAHVNGHLFINNASIGIYPEMVRRRDGEQDRHRLPKWIAALPASWATLKRLHHHRLRLQSAAGTKQVITPMLFVGNNHYDLDIGQVGKRSALDDGKLSVFAIARRQRLALIGFALRTLAGRADRRQDFAAIGDVAALTVTGRSRDIDVALDGEVRRLTMPLDFAIDPLALTVIAPG